MKSRNDNRNAPERVLSARRVLLVSGDNWGFDRKKEAAPEKDVPNPARASGWRDALAASRPKQMDGNTVTGLMAGGPGVPFRPCGQPASQSEI
jgi:hypothetical protein